MNNKKYAYIGLVAFIACLGLFLFLNVFKTYSITFETKLGPGVSVQNLKKGEKVEKPNDPTFEGYVFKGWYLNDEEYDFSTPVSRSITLEAKWEKVK